MTLVHLKVCRTFATLMLGAASLYFVSCGGGSEDTGSPTPSPAVAPIPSSKPNPALTTSTCPSGTSLTYENFGQGFMLNHCTTCHNAALSGSARHGAPGGVDFDTLNDVAIWNAGILAQAGTAAAKMPPAGSVTADERTFLNEWLKCGAPGTR